MEASDPPPGDQWRVDAIYRIVRGRRRLRLLPAAARNPCEECAAGIYVRRAFPEHGEHRELPTAAMHDRRCVPEEPARRDFGDEAVVLGGPRTRSTSGRNAEFVGCGVRPCSSRRRLSGTRLTTLNCVGSLMPSRDSSLAASMKPKVLMTMHTHQRPAGGSPWHDLHELPPACDGPDSSPTRPSLLCYAQTWRGSSRLRFTQPRSNQTAHLTLHPTR